MQSPWFREASQACLSGCWLSSFLPSDGANSKPGMVTSTKASRSNFATATARILFPNTQFTNHEDLPTLPEAFSNFITAYPEYMDTEQADNIREHEYCHMLNHICLDYTGIGLFSHEQLQSSVASSSSSPPPPPPPPPLPTSSSLLPPFFSISSKSTSIKSEVQQGKQENPLESAIRKRIMSSLNISDSDYHMVCTANTSSAFNLLAESFPFHTNKRLLTVYDHESEAVSTMVEIAQRRGAKVMSANFSWPGLRIKSSNLKKMVIVNRKKKKEGLFVFPLQSRITGNRYPYLWMALARENGWHVVLDACALGPKDMDTLGLSLIRPDFLICSFYKVFGENPSGFACLFVKKSISTVLETSSVARSIGVVSIIPAKTSFNMLGENWSADSNNLATKFQTEENEMDVSSSFPGPISVQRCNGSVHAGNELDEKPLSLKEKQVETLVEGETSAKVHVSSEVVELEQSVTNQPRETEAMSGEAGKSFDIECRALDHANSLGHILISRRQRYITNWLVNALMKLYHPHSENGHALIRIYGPRIKFDRGPAVAFNVFDWKGEKVEPALVQKLADRSNISLSCGFVHNIWFSDNYEEVKDEILEKRICEVSNVANKRKERIDFGISVVNASLGFLARFEDAYRLWCFVSRFLDADFVEKERWRYMALNQKIVEI